MRAFVVAILLVLFALACAAGALAAIVALPFASRYSSTVFKALDRAVSAVLGLGPGTATVSRECGGALLYADPKSKTCRFCAVLCAVLSWALREPDHCEREAWRE